MKETYEAQAARNTYKLKGLSKYIFKRLSLNENIKFFGDLLF